MTAFLRRWRAAASVAVVAGLIGALCCLAMPTAQAFAIQNHDSITRAALPADQVNQLGIAQILNGPPPGGGAVGSDAFALDDWRHIDNSKSPAEVCAKAQRAWDVFSPVILSGSLPAGPGATVLVNGPAARAAFGGLLHAQQDFYAHSNWVEENIAAGQPNRLAPPLFPSCNPGAFPASLHTGYFNLLFFNQFPFDGCPPGGPPPGFQECHSALNKDGPDTARGKQPVPGTGMNMYSLAKSLATTASTDLYKQVRSLVVRTVTAKYPGVNSECVVTKLFRPDLFGPCAPYSIPLPSAPAPPR
jgi:hypothetical protein